MKASPNKKIWKERGISPKGHQQCDDAMSLFLEAIRIAGGLAEIVFAEARFQVGELPKRTKAAQKRLSWKPER